MRLKYEHIAALLILTEKGRSDPETICELMAQALDELVQLGLVSFEPLTVEESELYIMFSGDYFSLTEKGIKVRKELLRRLKGEQ